MAEIVEDGIGAKPALTVLHFSFLTRLGCIDFSVEAFWLTCVGRFHLRAEAMTLQPFSEMSSR